MDRKRLNILYEDKHIIVCVKPAGVATQSKHIGSSDMVSILKNYIAESDNSKNSLPDAHKGPYIGLIHRLDQPVRGIMVFAKTPFAAKELSRQLNSGDFGKHYRALVSAKPPKSEGTLEDYLVKDGKNNMSHICSEKTPGAKLARLYYKVVPESDCYFENSCANDVSCSDSYELDIHLDTGRHHQIRVQLAGLGCPIIGDAKYNTASANKTSRQELKLCSYRLEFMHPKTKEPLCFSLL